MKLLSSFKFDSLMLPILLYFFYDLPIASGSISGPKIEHPAICTGTSGDLYWRIRRSVLVRYTGRSFILTGCAYRSFPAVTGVAARSARVIVEKNKKYRHYQWSKPDWWQKFHFLLNPPFKEVCLKRDFWSRRYCLCHLKSSFIHLIDFTKPRLVVSLMTLASKHFNRLIKYPESSSLFLLWTATFNCGCFFCCFQCYGCTCNCCYCCYCCCRAAVVAAFIVSTAFAAASHWTWWPGWT